jgi:hypothetical protein
MDCHQADAAEQTVDLEAGFLLPRRVIIGSKSGQYRREALTALAVRIGAGLV